MIGKLFAAALVLAAAPAVPADTGVGGSWRVEGKVASFAFSLNCAFEPDGDHFGGVCADASTSDPTIKPGRSHALTAGIERGGAVSWTYRSSFLFQAFDVTFNGVRHGDRITGTITVPGRQGAFVATRP